MSKLSLKDKLQHKKYLKKIKNRLYKQYCTQDNPYKDHNKDHIDYVVDKVLSKQVLHQNSFELQALQILSNRGIEVKYQEPIPILSEGGKLDHLYIADILYNNVIIEIDGSSHDRKQYWDSQRDRLTQSAGYITKRYKPSEIYKLKEETFV